jgi:ribosomal protein L37AE/L43A
MITDECKICNKIEDLTRWRDTIYVCADCHLKLSKYARKHQGRGTTNGIIIWMVKENFDGKAST